MSSNSHKDHVSAVIFAVLVKELQHLPLGNAQLGEVADKCTEFLLQKTVIESLVKASLQEGKAKNKHKQVKVMIQDNRA